MSNPLIQWEPQRFLYLQALAPIRLAVAVLCSDNFAPFVDWISAMGHLDVVSTFSYQNVVFQIHLNPSRSPFLQPAILAQWVETA
jgi:hypothetical protein